MGIPPLYEGHDVTPPNPPAQNEAVTFPAVPLASQIHILVAVLTGLGLGRVTRVEEHRPSRPVPSSWRAGLSRSSSPSLSSLSSRNGLHALFLWARSTPCAGRRRIS